MIMELTAEPELHSQPSLSDLTGGNVIGLSKEHRCIYCVPRGRMDAPLKVLILAGQHGDERPARRTVESLLAVPSTELAGRLPHLQLAFIPEANPDGCAARSRCNADGIDLNRDHQLLLSDEATVIHQFVRRWQPNVVLDLHSYPSRRLHLLARNVVLDHDVFLDVPNHPAILARSCSVDALEVLRGLLRTIVRSDVRTDRYTIVEASGRARHSTADVVDARNGLALRYGAFTILVENRQPRHDDDATERLRLRSAQERALWAILDWLDRHHDWFPPLTTLASPELGSPVPVHFRYKKNGHWLQLQCRDARRGQPASVTFPRYSASLEARRAVLLPSAYAVPASLEALTGLLHRHGFVSSPNYANGSSTVEKLRIERAHPARQPNRPPRKIVMSPHRMRTGLDQYEVFPTRQTGGEALAVYLEPESQHGLHRIAGLQLPLRTSSWYPVLRVLDGQGPVEP